MLILDMISLLEEYGILWRNYLRKQNSLFPPHGFEGMLSVAQRYGPKPLMDRWL